jgi:hypothetical protein
MDDRGDERELCSVCKDAITTIHADVGRGRVISVCEKCLESAKENFIWICMQCGGVYIRPKSLVLKRLRDPELKRAYAACEGLQIVQGIDVCVECEPTAIVEYVAAVKCGMTKGSC